MLLGSLANLLADEGDLLVRSSDTTAWRSQKLQDNQASGT